MGERSCFCCVAPSSETNVYQTTAIAEGFGIEFGAPAGTATEKTIAVQVVDEDGAALAGYFRLLFWLIDGAVPILAQTLTPPSGSGVTQWHGVTNANGQLNVVIINTDPEDSWHLCGLVLGLIYISDEIEAGV